MIADVCAKYPGSVLLFERLRKIKRGGGSKSRRMNRRQANHLRGKINHYAKDKNYAQGLVTVEVNPHGTSQYCSRCGAKGERFSYRNGEWVKEKWGKVFRCPVCHDEANADHNASKNMHHSFLPGVALAKKVETASSTYWLRERHPPCPGISRMGEARL
jgi:transposase